MYLAHNGTGGGCIWVRDIYNKGASNLVFRNNNCYKVCHDEILAVFSGSIENVEIYNNKFTMPESDDHSVMCFTLGSASSTKAENITFNNNEIDCKSLMELVVLKKSQNVSIKNNNIKYTKVNKEFTNMFINIPENNVKNLEITDNNIEINNESSQSLSGMISCNSTDDIKFSKNNVVVNSNISEVITGGIDVSYNNITLNGSVHVVANKPKMFSNNKIAIEGKLDAYFQYFKGELAWDSYITGNDFYFSYDEKANDSRSTILVVNGAKLNNHTINFKENNIKGENINNTKDLIYNLNIADETPQTINIIGNNIPGYKKYYPSSVNHNVILEDNTLN